MKRLISAMVCLVLVFGVLFGVMAVPVSAGSNDVNGIEDGASYYIKNVNTKKYLDINGSLLSGVTTNNFAGPLSTAQRWKASRNSDGSYVFKPWSNLNFGMGVNSGSNTVVTRLYTSSTIAEVSFYLTRINDGSYYMSNKARDLCPHAILNSVSLNSSFADTARWSFEKAEKRDADLYAFEYSNYNSSTVYTMFEISMNTCGYTPYPLTNSSAGSAYTYMQYTDDIVLFRGHATAGILPFRKSSGLLNGTIIVNGSYVNKVSLWTEAIGAYEPLTPAYAIDSLPTNALASLKCVLLMGCSTGANWTIPLTYNLVGAMYNKGAHFVMGPKYDISDMTLSNFSEWFVVKAKDGGTIDSCIDYACKEAKISRDNFKCSGDVLKKIK